MSTTPDLSTRIALRMDDQHLFALANGVTRAREIIREELAKSPELAQIRDGIQAWLHTYTPENCDDDAVARARHRIVIAGGTVGYISDLFDAIGRLTRTPPPPAARSRGQSITPWPEDAKKF